MKRMGDDVIGVAAFTSPVIERNEGFVFVHVVPSQSLSWDQSTHDAMLALFLFTE